MTNRNIISVNITIKDALKSLNELIVKSNLTLFVVDDNEKLIATLTDGDIRRGLLRGVSIDDSIESVMNKKFSYITLSKIDSNKIKEFREREISLVPLVDEEFRIIKIIDLTKTKGFVPVDVVIMAGGEGSRLRPLTLDIPKPLLKVGDKPIIEHNIDRLLLYGVDNFFISVKYLSEKIKDHLGNGSTKNVDINYVMESAPLGTIGAIKLIPGFRHNEVLVMNSDLLTNIDFEDFYNFFKLSNADMAVATIPYSVNVPYAVIELDADRVKSLKEKPTYTYYSNAGIYLLKKEVVDLIPKLQFFNATDLMESIIEKGMKLVNYPILGYWLDIGSHADYAKAQEDIKHIQIY